MLKPSDNPKGPGAKISLILAKMLGLTALLAIFLSGLLIPTVGGAGVFVRAGADTFNYMPIDFKIVPPSEQSTLLASDGSVIAKFYAEDRIVVDISDMSEWIQKAIVATEDRRFFQHKGVDMEGIARALVNNVLGRKVQGGSTLTQQFVKNTLVEQGIQTGNRDLINQASSRSIVRKLREARYALALEQTWTKEQILAGYLNIAPFGSSIYGVEAAAQHYFSKSAKDLTLEESAILAGITQAPTTYNPETNPTASQKRRDVVLEAMRSVGYIDDKQLEEAKAQNVKDVLNISSRSQGCITAGSAAYFCTFVVQELMKSDILGKSYSERHSALLRGGLTLQTSLDPVKQEAAQNAVDRYVPKNDPSDVRAGLVSIEPQTGNIVAMAQNTDYGFPTETDPSATQNSFTADYDHGGSLGFQTGSSFKPVTLAAWFAAGHDAYETVGGKFSYTAREFHSSCPDKAVPAPWTFKNAGGGPAATTVLLGTQNSLNSTYAGMLSKLDMCDIRQMAIDLGAIQGNGKLQPEFLPSAIIGTGSVPPLYMANMYSAFINNGKQCKPRGVVGILDRDGKKITVPPPACKQAIEEKVAQQVATVLKNNYNHYGPAQMGRPAIAKTGTTDGASDAWLAGAIPQNATAVWVGHEKTLSPMLRIVVGGRYYSTVWGSTIPTYIWRDYYAHGMEGMEVEAIPSVFIGNPPPPPPEPKSDDNSTSSTTTDNQSGDEGED